MAAAAVLATVAACRERPAAGGRCSVPDQLVCARPDRALLCEPAASGGVTAWQEVPCKGARGCSRRNDADECDDTVGDDGDPCPRSPPLDYACTSDHVRALVCKDG